MKIKVIDKLDFAYCKSLDCIEYANAHRLGATFEIKQDIEKYYNIYFPAGTILDTEDLTRYFDYVNTQMTKRNIEATVNKWIASGKVEKIKKENN